MAEPILLAKPEKRASSAEGGVEKTMDRRIEPKKSCIACEKEGNECDF